jgi:deoxycytidylate deaminase
MKAARTLAEDNQSCYSRKIGVVLVDEDNSVTCGGWNGTIRRGPANDSHVHLDHVYKDLLTADQREFARANLGVADAFAFAHKYADCKTCPRRLLQIPSGEGLELCNCAHAERNALANANRGGLVTTHGAMFCYCPLPCRPCAEQIIQAGIAAVICLKVDFPDYSISSRGLFREGGITVIEATHEEIFNEPYGASYAGVQAQKVVQP